MRIDSYLSNTAAAFPLKTALICEEARFSYADIDHLSDELSGHLQQMGLAPGDRVLLLLGNSHASVVSLFAVLKTGGTFSLVNPQIKSLKLNFILRNSGAKILVADSRLAPVIEASLSAVAELGAIVWVGGDPGISASSPMLSNHAQFDFQSLVAAPAPSAPGEKGALADDPDALSTIIYTSGSTGDPKGVMCPHRAMDAAAQSIIEYLGLSSQDTVIVLLPLAFDYGLYQILMTFKVGGTVVLQGGFDYPQRVRQILKDEKVSILPIVPTIADMLLRRSQVEPLAGLAVRAITNTAAPLTTKHIDGLGRLFPDAAIYAMYGLTECKRVAYLPPHQIRKKPGSVGMPMRGVKVRIADENGNPLPPGQIGELLVQGPNVMQGYWKDPESTDRVFQRDPETGEVTLHSGDLFRRDEEGFLYFAARKDDMVKILGERVYPLEVEKVLQQMPGIRECAVLGVTGNNGGNCLVAAVVPHGEENLSENDLRSFCKDRLEPNLIPKNVYFIYEMPKLPNGKIDKQRLKITCQEPDRVSDCQMPTEIDMLLPSNQLKTISGAH